MDHVREMALKEKPKPLCVAHLLTLNHRFCGIRSIADEVGAYLLADIAHIAGLVATGHHPNPFRIAMW